MTFDFVKGENGIAKAPHRRAPFVRVHHSQPYLYLNIEVRNAILPHKYVHIVLDGSTMVLSPSDSPTDYAAFVNARGGGVQLAYARLSEYIEFPRGERIPAEITDDGTIRIIGKRVDKLRTAEQGGY